MIETTLPLAVRVTEYQMIVRRCPACGKRTRADLPAGVLRRPFGARLTAVITLRSGRYRLSRREVRQLTTSLLVIPRCPLTYSATPWEPVRVMYFKLPSRSPDAVAENASLLSVS